MHVDHIGTEVAYRVSANASLSELQDGLVTVVLCVYSEIKTPNAV